jgi:hypothetical protein
MASEGEQRCRTISAIVYTEEGMREGMQIEDANIPIDAKVALHDVLSETGLKRIVVGSFVSPRYTPQMARIDELMHKFHPQEKHAMTLPRALDGIRVVDFSWVRAGPWATRWLGALGAEIIKIEWPENERGRLPSSARLGPRGESEIPPGLQRHECE